MSEERVDDYLFFKLTDAGHIDSVRSLGRRAGMRVAHIVNGAKTASDLGTLTAYWRCGNGNL
jgi:hypothetical protein